ncbi:hypothetical protein SAMD00019534_004500 [Acytostelium subglobosum LB1]|uniref:hypothetical protein n=1 Tax=Acytostelium subglobosum LB1 TaxID=1410327 RepID=UPI0006451E63|nr:hypothetical protein SAMD00019534_004500 [Acytostelium subglobosum LB1]GAM17275.1 hypothetical protein SAMD00019534_004500 [Acytostelium subglobosum LB1]|eukprot:XP_012759337.1 hypothetical protein SAMD00019534_004500 [Acytostelium subglobosum LB1]
MKSSDIGLIDRPTKTWSDTLKNQLMPTSGDINAMFSVLLDNLANIASMYAILVYNFGMPSETVALFFIPGPALGVMLGSISLSLYAIYLDHKNVEDRVLYTAIPMGLDAPSTIGLQLLVVGPAFVKSKAAGRSDYDATIDAWLVGCTTVFLIGMFKLLLTVVSFAQRYFHPVGKSAALAGIGLSLLGLNELLTILVEPVAGWISLWLIFLILLQRVNQEHQIININLPFNLSGVLVSAVIGSTVYYIMAAAKISVVPMPTGVLSNYLLSYPHPADIFSSFVTAIKQNISIALPYAILVNIGGLTVTDAAVSVGNEYNTRVVLFLDAVCTIISSFFGSTTQTTPYIGHSVFQQKFKARSGYSMITGLLIGLGGFLGYISFLTNILPKPAIIPIFIFIAFEICSATFHPPTPNGIKQHHAPAIIFAFFPALFQFVNIILSQVSPVLSFAVTDPVLVEKTFNISEASVQTIGVIVVLAHGFICTSLFWGTSLAYVLDNKLKQAALFLGITAVLTFFGIIHSVNPNGEVYVPWQSGSTLPYQWAAGYLIIAIMTFAFSYVRGEIEQVNLGIQAPDFEEKSFDRP